MRQLTYVEAGVVQWREVPDPELADPAGALVAPLAVARCDLDLPMAAQGLFPGPFGVGHETVATVVDVGTTFIDGKLTGDVAYEEVAAIVREITPVPGGVGPVTNVALMRNVVLAAERLHPG